MKIQLDDKYKLGRSSISSVLQHADSSSLSDPNILLRALVLDTLFNNPKQFIPMRRLETKPKNLVIAFPKASLS